MEIDHIFIFTDKNAPEGDLLKKFGLKEGTSNKHPGQGTANKRFFFKNFMLELIWVENLEEIKNPLTLPTKLYEHSVKDKNTCPFGLIFRPSSESDNEIPFSTWDYHPIYLPAFLSIQISNENKLCEPAYFYLSFAKSQNISAKKEIINNYEITNIKVNVNQKEVLSNTAQQINNLKNINIENNIENLLELEFNFNKDKKSKDFRPDLPLIINY